MKSGFPCISAASSKNSIGGLSAKLTVQLLPILAIAVALKLDHLNLGKRERSRRRQAWTEECEGVSGELLFRIPEDFRPATILRSAISSFFSSTSTPSSGCSPRVERLVDRQTLTRGINLFKLFRMRY